MRPEVGRINRVSALGLWPLLGTKHNRLLDLTGPSLGTSYESPHLRVVCLWRGKKNVSAGSFILLVSGSPYNMLNPTGQVPRVSCLIWTRKDSEQQRKVQGMGGRRDHLQWYPC